MIRLRRALVTALLAAGLALTIPAHAQDAAQPQQQDEFIPIDQLPPQDQLPAAPLLIGAYAFVMLALFGYMYSVARRLTAVEREFERLERDVKRSTRG
jgi:CcmD family protein